MKCDEMKEKLSTGLSKHFAHVSVWKERNDYETSQMMTMYEQYGSFDKTIDELKSLDVVKMVFIRNRLISNLVLEALKS